MKKPIIHLNGSSAATLWANYSEAHELLANALESLSFTAPHARDYYLEEGAYEVAREEHLKRVDNIQSVLGDLKELIKHTKKHIK